MPIHKTRRGGQLRSKGPSRDVEPEALRAGGDDHATVEDPIVVNSTQKQPVRERSSYADALSVAHMFAARFDVARSRDKGVAEAGTDKAKGDTRAAKNGKRAPAKKLSRNRK